MTRLRTTPFKTWPNKQNTFWAQDELTEQFHHYGVVYWFNRKVSEDPPFTYGKEMQGNVLTKRACLRYYKDGAYVEPFYVPKALIWKPEEFTICQQ